MDHRGVGRPARRRFPYHRSDLAEEALHDAFRAALEQWPRDGVPPNPRAWLVSAGRFKAINGIRRRARFDALDDVAEQVDAAVADTAE